MDERDFARFEFKMRFGRKVYIAQVPIADLRFQLSEYCIRDHSFSFIYPAGYFYCIATFLFHAIELQSRHMKVQASQINENFIEKIVHAQTKKIIASLPRSFVKENSSHTRAQ